MELDTLRTLLLQRLHRTVHGLVDALSETGVRTALARNTGLESLHDALSEIDVHAALGQAAERVQQLRDLHRAQAELLVRAGGAVSAAEAGVLLGNVTRQAVDKRRARGALIAVHVQGEFRYSLFQFDQSAILTALPKILRAFPVRNDWTRLSLLLAPQDGLDGRTIIDALRNAQMEEALTVAAGFADTGG